MGTEERGIEGRNFRMGDLEIPKLPISTCFMWPQFWRVFVPLFVQPGLPAVRLADPFAGYLDSGEMISMQAENLRFWEELGTA